MFKFSLQVLQRIPQVMKRFSQGIVAGQGLFTNGGRSGNSRLQLKGTFEKLYRLFKVVDIDELDMELVIEVLHLD